MKVNELLEMAKSQDFNPKQFSWATALKDKAIAKEVVKAFRSKNETYDFENGRKFKAKTKIMGDKLKPGMVIFASSVDNKTPLGRAGGSIYEVLKIEDPSKDPKWGQYILTCKDLESGKDEEFTAPTLKGYWSSSVMNNVSFHLVEEVK